MNQVEQKFLSTYVELVKSRLPYETPLKDVLEEFVKEFTVLVIAGKFSEEDIQNYVNYLLCQDDYNRVESEQRKVLNEKYKNLIKLQELLNR